MNFEDKLINILLEAGDYPLPGKKVLRVKPRKTVGKITRTQADVITPGPMPGSERGDVTHSSLQALGPNEPGEPPRVRTLVKNTPKGLIDATDRPARKRGVGRFGPGGKNTKGRSSYVESEASRRGAIEYMKKRADEDVAVLADKCAKNIKAKGCTKALQAPKAKKDRISLLRAKGKL